MDLIVEPGGVVRCIYDETLDVAAFGRPTIARASHVEPNADGAWTADLTPTHGPILGPFPQRSQALDAEMAWLRKHWLGGCGK